MTHEHDHQAAAWAWAWAGGSRWVEAAQQRRASIARKPRSTRREAVVDGPDSTMARPRRSHRSVCVRCGRRQLRCHPNPTYMGLALLFVWAGAESRDRVGFGSGGLEAGTITKQSIDGLLGSIVRPVAVHERPNPCKRSSSTTGTTTTAAAGASTDDAQRTPQLGVVGCSCCRRRRPLRSARPEKSHRARARAGRRRRRNNRH